MLNFSYNISPDLKDHLKKIDDLRSSILSQIISPRQEIKIRFESTIERIYYILLLCGIEVNKSEVQKVLTNPFVISTSNEERRRNPMGSLTSVRDDNTRDLRNIILSLKKSLDYISQEWLANSSPVLYKHIELLSEISFKKKINLPQNDTRKLLEYISAQPDHPVVQAGVIFKQIRKSNLQDQNFKLLSHLVMLLFFYKNGFDIKGFFVLEKEWFKYKAVFDANNEEPITNLTLWLEYFAGTVSNVLENLLLKLTSNYPSGNLIPASFVDLNDRQKSILTLLDTPDTKITNKKVARSFGVSQITASRDLSRLAQLGLLFSHGRGRSVYYTKV